MKNTKSVIISIVMLSLAIAGLTSCNNDDREENMSSLKKSVSISSNSNNPFDTEGINHNVWLAQLLQEREEFEKKNNISFSGNKDQLFHFYYNYLLKKGESIERAYHVVNEILLAEKKGNDCFLRYIDAQNLSTESQLLVRNMIVTSIRMSIDNPKLPYEAYGNYIKGLERDILNGKTAISKEEMRSVLIFTSIIRHSMHFWLNYDGCFDIFEGDTPEPRYSFWSVVLGAAIGGLVGSLLGPKGTAAGAAIVSALILDQDIQNGDAIVIEETPDGEIKIIYIDNNKDDKKENNQ